MEFRRYDYEAALREDIRNYITSEIDLEEWRGNREGLEEHLNEVLWNEDSVTGNSSGSYTMSAWQAEENLCHNLPLLSEACREFGGDLGDTIDRGAEYCDVTIRCYLLHLCVAFVLDMMEYQLV